MSNETTHLMMTKPINYSVDVTVFIMAAEGGEHQTSITYEQGQSVENSFKMKNPKKT